MQNPNGHMRLWNPTTGEVHACETWQTKLSRIPGGLEAVKPTGYKPPAKIDWNSPPPSYSNHPATQAMEKATGNGNGQTGIGKDEIQRMILSGDNAVRIDLQNAKDILSQQVKSIATGEINLRNALADLETRIAQTREITILKPNGSKKNIGRQHKKFPDLLEYCALRLNVMLVGPAGSGKSTAAAMVAKALDLPFYLFPMGPAVTDSKLLGYMDANGKVVRTPFRNAYENGGVIILDEMDTANPAALTCLNGALANGHVAFPDGMIARHPDLIVIAGANTYGRGADRVYVGRTQLDEATLDRFLTEDWDYDRDLELEIAGTDQRAWVEYVWKVRNVIESKNLRVTATPRVSIEGAKMLRAGISLDRVKKVRLFNKMPKDAIDTISQNMTI
jgi:cobaltochelatase CobS